MLNIVTGVGSETGAGLVSHPDIAKITFTGGPATATAILGSAALTLTPSLMELGGKGPMIVAADADLEVAVQDALMGIYLANGEACIASSRLLLHDDIHDEFVVRFSEVARSIAVGDATDPATEVGPLVSRRQLDYEDTWTGRVPKASRYWSATRPSTSILRSPEASTSAPCCWPTRTDARPSRAARFSAPSRSPSASAPTRRR